MASEKQSSAARKNIKKASRAAKRKKTLKHLPKKTRRTPGQTSSESQKVTTVNGTVTNRGKDRNARILVTPEIATF